MDYKRGRPDSMLRNDPGMGVIRHADAGHDIAKERSYRS